MGPPMRSSIACLRCRKSKIKCDNDGGVAACETCIKSGQECKYPDQVAPPVRRQASVPVKRPDAPEAATKQERDLGPERKRKKLEDIATWLEQRSNSYTDEVLSYPFLRGEIWEQVFIIFRTHFSTELPFLHFPTLKEKINRKHRDTESDRELNLVLLGILTLTARFHPDIPKYVAAIDPSLGGNSPGGGPRSRPGHSQADPSAGSDFYARGLTTALGMVPTAVAVVSVERIQAYLMLGLHEWTRNQPGSGVAAWMYVGIAIRMAQAMRLGYENGGGAQPSGASSGGQGGDRGLDSRRGVVDSDAVMEREMRRRTMFSCLILDRLLAVGPERVSAIRSDDLHIQLPCSEQDFDLANEAHTGYLHHGRPGESLGLKERGGKDDSLLSRFVILVDFWGEITRYSFAGGRQTEGNRCPWQDGSTFKRLREKLDEFYDNLPDTFTFSRKNFYRHDNHPATTGMFVSLHMLGAVCQIMIHREYIPFLPIRCRGPEGPRDPPFILEKAPQGFWEESAEQVFKAARDIADLIELSGEKLPNSALVLFAIWSAAFVGLYALHFPHMDQKRHMVSEAEIQARYDKTQDHTRNGATGVTYSALKKMQTYLPAAAANLKRFVEFNGYFSRVTSDYHKQADIDKFVGGGLQEWKEASGRITSNGNVHVFPTEYNGKTQFEGPGGNGSRASTQDRASSVGAETFNSGSVATPRSAPATSFTAINSGHGQQGPSPVDHGMKNEQHDGQFPQHHHGLSAVPIPGSPPYSFFAVESSPTLAPQVFTDFGYDGRNITGYVASAEYTRLGPTLGDLGKFASGEHVPLDPSFQMPLNLPPELQSRNAYQQATMIAASALEYQG